MTTMTTIAESRLFPGMTCSGVEFFKSNNGVKVISSGTVKAFKELPTPIYELLKEAMHKESGAYELLSEWYPDSELCKLEKFTECRFGGLDYTADIVNNQLQDGEYHDCPFRGQCKGEGVLCKSLKYNGHVLSNQDIMLLQLLATNETNDVIAEKITTSLGQFHKVKKALYVKLGGIQTKQEAALIANDLNVIKRISAIG